MLSVEHSGTSSKSRWVSCMKSMARTGLASDTVGTNLSGSRSWLWWLSATRDTLLLVVLVLSRALKLSKVLLSRSVGVGIDGVAVATGAGVEGAGGVGDGDAGVDDAAALAALLLRPLLLLVWAILTVPALVLESFLLLMARALLMTLLVLQPLVLSNTSGLVLTR